MQPVRIDIISIGTLARNRLWNESEIVRTEHATTALIRSGRRNILVDPGLPAPAIGARLFERAGLLPEQIDTIFLTNFSHSHWGGLPAFPKAQVFIHETEQQARLQQYQALIDQAPSQDLDRKQLQVELSLLETMKNPEDKIANGVDLYPLFGSTPGNCGLLISLPTTTILIAGDAIPTQDHFLAGQVLPTVYDLAAARESLQEIYEIADLIVPGYDNIFPNPRSQGL